MTFAEPCQSRRLERLFTEPVNTPEFPPRGSRIALYGAGHCGVEAARLLREGGWEVAGVIDRRAETVRAVEGVPCLLPGSAAARALADEGLPVVLAVFNFAVDSGAIALELREAGFARVIPFFELHETFGEALSSRFWLTKKEWVRLHREEILGGLSLWADEASRALYVDLIALRLTHDLQLLRTPDRAGQYFPDSLPRVKEPLRFIDGGAYTGDTLPALFQFQVEAVAAFEPDPANFSALVQAIRRQPALPREVALFPCGLDEETRTLRFSSGNTSSSAVSETGNTVIQVAALDDVLPSFAPTCIKLDIEGAEPAALRGMRQTLQTAQPRVAACVYHLPEHLWEIPAMLHELLPGHRLHLRLHGFNGFDVVAYAIPQ